MSSSADGGYLAALGVRVQVLRKARNLSRRALSERSGLSQRFIAQLESGAGNISILRLKALLDALDADIVSVLSDDSKIALPDDALAIRVMNAPAHARARVADILDDTSGRSSAQARRIALIGLRGAGKSTLGRIIAETLQLEFVELNAEIQRENGLDIGEIFSLYGEEGYRRLEREQLLKIAERDNLVLAVAGGIVDSAEAYEFLRNSFSTVWLQTSPDEHMARVVAQGDSRPMADNPHAMDDLLRILATRRTHYARADVVLDTSGEDVEVSAQKLADLVREKFLGAVP